MGTVFYSVLLVTFCTSLAKDAEVRCSQGYYECYSYYNCIQNQYVCDGHEDCYYGDDEKNCGSTSYPETTTRGNFCPEGTYQCESGQCITNSWVCDQVVDCPSGDDEKDCSYNSAGPDSTTAPSCPDGWYQCSYDYDCIPPTWVCDGYEDCYYGDDEYEYNCSNHTQASSTTTSSTPPSTCSGAFDYIYDRCVLIDPFTHTSWSEARYLCQRFDADLLVINDFSLYGELLHYIKSKGLDNQNYWVGARDEVEGKWRWVDYSLVPSGAPLWALYGCANEYSLEPRPSDASGQDCAYLDKSRGLYMSDASCTETFGAICETRGSRTLMKKTEIETKGNPENVDNDTMHNTKHAIKEKQGVRV